MTVEKTKEMNQDGLDEETKRKLDTHNPVGNVMSDLKEQTVKIVDIDIPSINRILRSSSPSIKMVIELMDGKEESFELLMDRFSDAAEDERMTVTNFCLTLGIEREEIHKMKNEEIPLKVSKEDNKYEFALPSSDKDIEVEDKYHYDTRIDRLNNLWKAEEYGKGEIKSIESGSRGIVNVEVEVPWVNETNKLRFTEGGERSRSIYPDFDLFCEIALGRTPMNGKEIESLIGQEVSLDYSGNFGISQKLTEKMDDQQRDFSDYMKDNTEEFKRSALVNMAYVSVFYALPPFVLVPLSMAGFLSGTSFLVSSLIIVSMIALSSLGLTTYEAYRSYKDKEPIEPVADFSQ